MVTRLDWRAAYRIIPSLYPTVGIFDGVAAAADLEVILELEAATNPRILDAAGELAMVRPEDRIAGPGATPIMAAFTHTKPSRFSDGSYGVFYAAHDQATAVAETAFHRARFLRDARLRSEIVQMRVYRARIDGRFDDIRSRSLRSAVYDPGSYAASQKYGRRLYVKNEVDGIAFRSVRRSEGECAAVFRPRRIHSCHILRHLEYRFEDFALTAVLEVDAVSG
ncbi:MAG TPA: RES family NAD+ phosphorylase [Candidatus Baltobacteraceae bacterium]|nr:RES family NAD+ phosphorylase [Candidatus Baltobacteraceae bacterium]